MAVEAAYAHKLNKNTLRVAKSRPGDIDEKTKAMLDCLLWAMPSWPTMRRGTMMMSMSGVGRTAVSRRSSS